MESYHVIATHPTLLYEMGDANSQYDAFGVLSRAISAQGIASPHIEAELAGEPFDDTTPFTVYRHPITGDLYERLSEGDRKSTRLNSVTNAHLVCRLLLEKKKPSIQTPITRSQKVISK